MTRDFCLSSCSRRQFLSGCMACAGCVTGGALVGPHVAWAVPAVLGKTKVRAVFCETPNDQPIWPNINYDFAARRKRLLEMMAQGCPNVQLLPTQVMDDPKDAMEVLQGDGEVDGYLVLVQGLGWKNDIFKLCTTGKPTLLVDNLFGGSGHFLGQLPRIIAANKPVDWVSSSNDEDIIASTRNFGLLAQGKTAAEVARAFSETRRKNTPAAADMTCKPDFVSPPNFDEALRKLRETKILVVGGGWGGEQVRKTSEEVLGVKLIPIAFEEMSAAYDAADPEAAKAFADRWIAEAQQVVEPTREQVEKAGTMYVGMKKLLEEHRASGISINCLGGFYGGHLKAYPCLGFSQLNNDGLVGGCEADQRSALTMATMALLVGRPGFISDPVIDTSKNQIIYAHCVAMTRPFGPGGPTNPYRIRNHSEDRQGAAIQSLLPDGYMTTTLEIDPVARQVFMHRAKAVGNNPSDMACRTKLEAVVQGDIEKLSQEWRLGWHRVTFYGDLKDSVSELCQRTKMQVIEEA